jgi:hypothetical protein
LVLPAQEHLQVLADTQLQKEQMAEIAYSVVIPLLVAAQEEHHTIRLATALEMAAALVEAALVIITE